MPFTMPKIWEQIGASGDAVKWGNALKFGALGGEIAVKKGEVLFPRIDLEKEIDELNALLAAQNPAGEKKAEEAKQEIVLADEITIDDFAKVELRVAKVLSCEKVPKSDKLLCLKLDDGMGGRQVVSGIAEWYSAEDLVGKKIIVVANLKPAKLRGVESNGMILAADAPDGSAKVVFPDQDLPCGAKIR
ncbi:MAG TPA: methionine--tRNA ligase subunit beta, partial [Oscillospiraceae bacterium]|nr:methionine--tRNA ligase subunit beta [Oscillospiraceae bacterium]